MFTSVELSCIIYLIYTNNIYNRIQQFSYFNSVDNVFNINQVQ